MSAVCRPDRAAEFLLDFFDPVEVGLENASAKGVEKPELAPAVGKLRFATFGLVKDGRQLLDLGSQRFEALDNDAPVVGEVACLNPDRSIALDAREMRGPCKPFPEGGDALLREAVVGSLACLAGCLL